MKNIGRWAALVGGAREGRDATIDLLVEQWRSDGLAVGGFRPRDGQEHDDRGKPLSMFLEDLHGGARVPLAVTDPTAPDVCSYRFDEAAFAAARQWCAAPGLDVVLLGGLGPLEAAGRGHAPLIRAIVTEPHPALPVLAIRRDALAAIALQLPDPVADLELPAATGTVAAFARQVERAVRGQAV